MKKITLLFVFAFLASLILGSNAFGQIAQRGTATSATSQTTTITITKPTGVVSGDVMLVNITSNNGSAASLLGWTSLGTGIFNGSNLHATVLYRVAGGSEPASYIFSLGAGANDAVGTIVAFSGVDNTTPIDATGTMGLSVANGGTATAPGITTTTASAAVVMFANQSDNRNYTGWTTTSPGGLTEIAEFEWTNGSQDMSVGAAWATKASAGATGNGTVTLEDNNDRWAAMLVALRQGPIPTPNLWGIQGTDVVNFSVSAGSLNSGPSVRFAQTVGTSSAALARTDKPTLANGYFYWLLNSGTNGIVQVFGSDANGGSQTAIGSLDVNGAGNNNTLGFVRLGARADGVVFGIAGDGTTIYLFQFKPNGVTVNGSLPVADQLSVTDANVTLSGGLAATFVNGDLCLAGDGNIVALANNGSGLTQIFTGLPNGSSTTLTQKFNVLDNLGNGFTGSVNGVAFDVQGSLYVSTSGGLYYINQATVNGPAATINIAQVWSGSGLTDLASNFFPTTIITPVKFGSFTVVRQGSNAMLNWNTLTEINTDHFEIERSTDGVNFVTVGNRQSAGNSTENRSYQYLDPIAGMSGVLYYRIKVVDIDAKKDYSKIVLLRLDGMIVKNFNVYPNPFTDNIKLLISSDKETEVTIRISNAAGQTVVSRKAELQKGDNVIVLTSELKTLQSGVHFMDIISAEGIVTQKIIKR